MANIILRSMFGIELVLSDHMITYFSFGVYFAEIAQHIVLLWLIFRLFSLQKLDSEYFFLVLLTCIQITSNQAKIFYSQHFSCTRTEEQNFLI